MKLSIRQRTIGTIGGLAMIAGAAFTVGGTATAGATTSAGGPYCVATIDSTTVHCFSTFAGSITYATSRRLHLANASTARRYPLWAN